MQKRNLLISLGLLTIAALAAVWSWWPEQAGKTTTAPAAATQATPATPAPVPSARAVRASLVGARFALHHAMQARWLGENAGPAMALSYDAVLELAPLPSDGERQRIWAARLSEVKLQGEGLERSGSDITQSSAAERTAVWLAVYEADGHFKAVRFAGEGTVGWRGLCAQLADALQIVAPESPGPEWQTDERDLNGPYHARYSLDGARLHKERTPPERNPGAPIDKIEATVDFELKAGRIAALRAHQGGEVRTGTPGVGAALVYSNDITLRRLGPSDGAFARSVNLADFRDFLPDALAFAEPPVSKSYQALLTAADAAAASGDWQERARNARELGRAIRADDKLARQAAAELRAGGLDEPGERTRIEALASAASPAAQHELLGMMRDEGVQPALRDRVVQATALLQGPNAELMRGLTALAVARADLAYASRVAMALGALAGQDVSDDPAAATEARTALIEQAKATLEPTPADDDVGHADPAHPPADAPPGPRTRANWVLALGNSGLPEALGPILTALEDENELVRQAAAQAIRFQPAEKVLPIVQPMLRDEPSIFVRSALYFALRYYSPDVAGDIVTAGMRNDLSEHVRGAAAHTMASWSVQAPALRQRLKDALAHEKSERLRESYRNYLESGRAPAPIGGQP